MIGRCLCAITYALAFPAPAFVGGRLAFRRVSLAEVWKVLPPDPWFLIPDAPFGLLLAVANALLLRPRAPDTLAAAVGLGMLGLFVFGPPIGAWLSSG